MEKRGQVSGEFTQEAVQLVREGGAVNSQVARDIRSGLGYSDSVLSNNVGSKEGHGYE